MKTKIAALAGSALLLVGTLVVPQAASAQTGFNADGHVTKVVIHNHKPCLFSEGQTIAFVFEATGIGFVFTNTSHGPAGTLVGSLPPLPTAPATKWDGTYQFETLWNGGNSGILGPNKFTATIVSAPPFAVGSMTLQNLAYLNVEDACDVTIEYSALP